MTTWRTHPAKARKTQMMERGTAAHAVLLGLLFTGCGTVSGLPAAGPAGDTTAPTVAATVPAAEATVPADGVISITFSEPMTARSVVVTAQPPIAFGPAAWSADDRTVTFRPQTPLSPGTRYTVAVTGRDRAGNAMAAFSWRFAAGGPGARPGTAAVLLQGRVEARPDERLFTLFSALNASGYDDGLKESGAVREAVRERLGELSLKTIEPIRRFRADHPRPLAAYVAYVLRLGPPPELAEQRGPEGLSGLNRILADFYAAGGIADLWRAHRESHARAAGALAAEAIPLMGRAMDYARLAEAPPLRFVLLPNLLDAPGREYLVRQDETVTFVFGSLGTVDRLAVTRLTVRTLLNTGRAEITAEVRRTSPLFDLIRETAQRQGYDEWVEVVRESLGAAIVARLVLPAEERERFLREQYTRGLLLAEHFAAELAKYERETVPLLDFFPQMLRSVNLDEQRRIFAERKR